jgi:hypothetical protein
MQMRQGRHPVIHALDCPLSSLFDPCPAQGYTGLIVAGGHGGFQAVLRAPADFV